MIEADFSGDTEALDVLDLLDPVDHAATKKGPGGVGREDTQGLANTSTLVQDGIISTLNKARKMQVGTSPWRREVKRVSDQDAQAPPHLILPHVLSSIQLSIQLGLWPLYRIGVVAFAELLLSTEGHGLGERAVEEVEKVWPEVSLG